MVADTLDDFGIFCLLYGNYPELAKRCLESVCSSIKFLQGSATIYVCCNSVSEQTKQVIKKYKESNNIVVFYSDRNIHKYPMMRYMFYSSGKLQYSKYVMWFDDDSYISNIKEFWPSLLDYLSKDDFGVVGSRYYIGLRNSQIAWIEDQDWYSGVPISKKVDFITGGWWVAQSEILKKHDWPTRELNHRGGDVMFSMLCKQQGYKLGHFNKNVAINADVKGRESKAQRRGFDESPIGYGYKRAIKENKLVLPTLDIGVN